ncbi:MAG: hypothetical protein OXD44_02305 [Gammaproteobacteria bacterium]|nr:hypothetical protein [Gammaproteobacteria bacterium]
MMNERSDAMLLAPFSLQCLPPRFSRVPTTFLHPALYGSTRYAQSLFPECLIEHSFAIAFEIADHAADFLSMR